MVHVIKNLLKLFRKKQIKLSAYVLECLSHPDKKLQAHTKGVCAWATSLFPSLCVRTASLLHDWGKMINYNFQDYKMRKKVPAAGFDPYTNHGYLGYLGLLAYCLGYLQKYGKYPKGVIENETDFLLISICIIKHHGGLPNLCEAVKKEELDRALDFIAGSQEPFQRARHRAVIMASPEFLCQVGLTDKKEDFDLRTLTVNNALVKFTRTHLQRYIKNKLDFFLDLRMCFSALICGDKGDAGRKKLENNRQEIFCKEFPMRVRDYMSYLNSLKNVTELNRIRTEMRNKAIYNLKKEMNQNRNNRGFCLTYPTGAGKSATLYEGASKIIEKRGNYRVLYNIPFLSLTEQIFKEILGNAEGTKGGGIFKGVGDLVKRIDSKAQPRDEYDDEKSLPVDLLNKLRATMKKIFKKLNKYDQDSLERELLKESFFDATFDYPMIVTTFVQFFQAFTTSNNRSLMKFSHLSHSIFLIDELQSLPPCLYTFFAAMIVCFCEKFDSYVIFSSATMPCFKIPVSAPGAQKLFAQYIREPVEIGDPTYFENPIFNRYEIHPIKNKITVSELVNRVRQETKPTLIILNTIRDSEQMYQLLKSTSKCPVILINTQFYSEDRGDRLKRSIDMLKKGEMFFLVTTQVIEAGIDIDFDIVYRDIALFPNIVQASGRCNREGQQRDENGNLIRGIVYVFKLVDDKGNLRASTIYNGTRAPFLKFTEDKLFNSQKEVFEEKDLVPFQKEYFSLISENLEFGSWDDGSDKNFVRLLDNFRYGEIGQYSLISKQNYDRQEQFYVPESSSDTAYERLLDLVAERFLLKTENVPDKNYDQVEKNQKLINDHVHKMMSRVVQVRVPDSIIPGSISEYDIPLCHLYKLLPGYYNSDFGLNLSSREAV